ncbi:hypothetical protein BGZ49_006026 [Haplosporangium sp. Z 27]|nr:hypothetical protein BGZ49_006026 [Haplosporangium sp. Z 27]
MQHHRPRSPPYNDQYSSYRHESYHDSYNTGGNLAYHNGNHHHHPGNSKQNPYIMRGPYDDHYSPGVIHGDHIDGDGDMRHDIHNGDMNDTMMDKQRHNSISSNASSSSSGPPNKHPCKFQSCTWSFKRFEHLKRHMLVHTKERPFVCDFQGCEKSFSRSDNFSAHLRTHTKKSIHMRNHLDSMGFVPLNQSSSNGSGSHNTRIAGSPSVYPEYPVSHHSPPHNGSVSDPDYEGLKHSPPPSPSRFSPTLNHRHPSSPVMYSVNRSTRYPTETHAELNIPKHENVPTSVLSTDNTTKLSIKLEPKAFLSSLEDARFRDQGHPKVEFSHSHDRERDYHNGRHYQYRESYPHFEKPDFRSPSPPISPSDQRYGPGDYHRHKPMLGSGLDEPNPNPNGESPTQPPRPASPGYRSSNDLPHFVPLEDKPVHRQRNLMEDDNGTEDTFSSKRFKVDYYKSRPLQNRTSDEYLSPNPINGNLSSDRHMSGPYVGYHRRSASDYSMEYPPTPHVIASPHVQGSSLSAPGYPPHSFRAQHHHHNRSQSQQYHSYPSHMSIDMTPPQMISAQDSMTMSESQYPAESGGRGRGSTSSIKNHCCHVPGCMKRFKRLEHLKRHIKTHTLERPFACTAPGCNKRFSRSDNLSQHAKTHQRQVTNRSSWKQTLDMMPI